MRVIVVESDVNARRAVQAILENADITVEAVARGDEALDLVTLYDYDLMILDLNAQGQSGIEVLRSMRRKGITLPVMAVTGMADVRTKVDALSAGADDCLVKPFHADEITARVNAIVRRSRGHASSAITIGDLNVDIQTQTVSVSGRRMNLTAREYQIVEAMALRLDTTLTKEMLLNHLYGGMDEPELKIIDVFVCKIRKKIAAVGNGQDFIETVWGRGYCMRQAASTSVAA